MSFEVCLEDHLSDRGIFLHVLCGLRLLSCFLHDLPRYLLSRLPLSLPFNLLPLHISFPLKARKRTGLLE
jgi:hypothetical protein